MTNGPLLERLADFPERSATPVTYRGRHVLSADGARLRCSNHAAEFAVSDGRALSGPCGERGLVQVALNVAPYGRVRVNEGPGSPTA